MGSREGGNDGCGAFLRPTAGGRRVSNPPLQHDTVRGVWTVAEVAGVLVGGGDEGEPAPRVMTAHLAGDGFPPARE